MENNIRTLVPRQQFDNEQLELIRKTVAKGTTPEQFLLFIEVCKHYRLNPMARQIYAVVRGGQMVVQTSIDGFRLMAERTGLYAGQIGPQWCGLDGEWVDVWLKPEPPAAARIGILRKDFEQPVWGVARYTSYAQPSSTIWQKMPDVMTAKCAESLAFRRAFPAEMSGIYTNEEMQQADHVSMPVVEIHEATEADKKKARLNQLFKAGRAKGLYANKQEMVEYISAALELDLEADDLISLDEGQLWALEQEIEHVEMAEAS